VLWCLLAAALFGASTPAAKPLLEQSNPLLLSGALYLGAALATAPWALRQTRSSRSVDRKNVRNLAGAILFGGIAGPILLLTGLALTSAASVSLWLNLETVATAVLARIFFQEHLDRLTWIAVLLIVFASALLSTANPESGIAVLFVALACASWGLDNNLTSLIDRFSPAEVTFVKGLVAGTLNLVLGLVLTSGKFAASTLALGVLVGVLSYGASLLLYVASAQQLGAVRSQLVFSTAPIWGLTASWLVLGEALTWRHAAATALMGTSIWLWNRPRHSHPHRHVRTTHAHWHRHDDGHHAHAHPGAAGGGWHSHEHTHEAVEHAHVHRPDLHHRHEH
jgi:drug/metabolite transporter (DMT)-like permease